MTNMVVRMREQRPTKQDLIDLRNSLRLTQQEMADRLNMALRSYQAIEAGESEYRSIHRLAAERVALSIAADKRDPALSPSSITEDAIALVRAGEFIGAPAYLRDSKKDSSFAPDDSDLRDASFRASYAIVGEIVLLTSALDHQLNHILIQALHLTEGPMLETVIATLDMVRKIEMLKERSRHISQQNWKKPLLSYVDKLERVSKWRNIACHTVLIPDDKHGAVFVPTAAARLMKQLQLDRPIAQRTAVTELKPAIRLGESALFDGTVLIQNLQKMNAERVRRYGQSPYSRS
jgi:transcriptional regulator with XRE-family HTH domain